MENKNNAAILLIHCPDQAGIVYTVTNFIHNNKGNILFLDQHVDREQGVFFMHVQWSLEKFNISPEKISEKFDREVAKKYQMKTQLYFSEVKQKMAIFVSKIPHCFYDLLARYESGEMNVEIPLVISNHENLRTATERLGIAYHCLKINQQNKAEQEKQQLKLLQQHDVDLIVLARYMQVLSHQFVSQYPQKIINIHHSFLPAFPGGKPYHSAFERGVKIIGASSHYVTTQLDAGPIIEQDTVHISHKNTINDMVRIGRDLEKVVLARAVFHHLQHDLLVYKNRTVVFN